MLGGALHEVGTYLDYGLVALLKTASSDTITLRAPPESRRGSVQSQCRQKERSR